MRPQHSEYYDLSDVHLILTVVYTISKYVIMEMLAKNIDVNACAKADEITVRHLAIGYVIKGKNQYQILYLDQETIRAPNYIMHVSLLHFSFFLYDTDKTDTRTKFIPVRSL